MKKRSVIYGVGTQHPVEITKCHKGIEDVQLLIPEFINQTLKKQEL